MQSLDQFRIYYNHTIHPELLRLERKRRQLLLLLLFSFFLLIGIVILEIYLNILIVTLFLMLPIGLYITFLLYRIQKFRIDFKPKIVNLILDFIDDGLNHGRFDYDPKKFIPKKDFLSSRILATDAPYYEGEDYIKGKIGEVDFELCELNVREYSKVRNRLNYVFRGVFLHASFKQHMRGALIILPREFKQYLSRSIKAFTSKGGRSVDEMIMPDFREIFMVYATKEVDTTKLLSKDMQQAILEYKIKTDKEIYLSFVRNQFYIGVTEPKDILEPFIFTSNVSFDLVREFFEDIQLLISIVEDFDAHH